MDQNHPFPHRFHLSGFFSENLIFRDGAFSGLDEVDASLPGALAYCQNLHYLKKAKNNPNISAVICSPDLAAEIIDAKFAAVFDKDARRLFFTLYTRLSEAGVLAPEMIFGVGENCCFHPTAVISPKSRIGNRVSVGANAVVEDYCQIGDNVEIGPNVVVGAEGLITLRHADGGLLRIKHAGGVSIGNGCQILAGAVIAKSLFRRFTHIGCHSQIGIMANIGHGAYIGNSCVISGNSVIAGRTCLGDKAWVGTSASVAQGLIVGEGAQIKMGAVVVGDVAAGAAVSGNFAVNHRLNAARFLREKV